MRKFLSFFIAASACAVVALPAAAASITRAQFGPAAVNYNFDSASSGDTVAGNGELTVTNGRVYVDNGSAVTSGNAYYDGGDSSVITFLLAVPVSALGLNFLVNFANPTLSLFDSLNNLLESLTLSAADLPSCKNGLVKCGFIGIDFGTNKVAYATIDTPLNGNELYIDNVIYQRASTSTNVPEPETAALMLLALAVGMSARRRRPAYPRDPSRRTATGN